MTFDVALAKRVAKCDPNATETFIRDYRNLVRSVMLRTGISYAGDDPGEFESTMAELMAHVVHQLKQGKWHGRAEPGTWVWQVCRNYCADILRKQMKALPTCPIDLPEGEVQLAATEQTHASADGAGDVATVEWLDFAYTAPVSELSRAVVVETALRDDDYATIGDRHGKMPSHIGKILSEDRQKLRRFARESGEPI